MLHKGNKVQQDFGGSIMKVIGFKPDHIENVSTEWENENRNRNGKIYGRPIVSS